MFETFLKYEYHDFSCAPFDSEHSNFTEQLFYQEDLRWIYLDLSNKKKILTYRTASKFYQEIVERLKSAGPLGEKLLAAKRSGDPETIVSVCGFIDIDNLEEIEDFFYNFISYGKNKS